MFLLSRLSFVVGCASETGLGARRPRGGVTGGRGVSCYSTVISAPALYSNLYISSHAMYAHDTHVGHVARDEIDDTQNTLTPDALEP